MEDSDDSLLSLDVLSFWVWDEVGTSLLGIVATVKAVDLLLPSQPVPLKWAKGDEWYRCCDSAVETLFGVVIGGL